MLVIFGILPIFWIAIKLIIGRMLRFKKNGESTASILAAVLTLFLAVYLAYLLVTYKDM